ncbi:MAG: TRAP transporter small permease [Gemmatimonadales bacterium]|nr:TRAP transporter small permease [Gemmatimonadales bacterium]
MIICSSNTYCQRAAGRPGVTYPTGSQVMWKMKRRLRGFDRVLVTLETYAVGVLLIAVCDVVLLQVLMRYLFAYPNPWSEEVSRFCFIWLSLLGASLAVARRSHFRFDQVTGRLPPRVKKAVERFAAAVVLLFALVLLGTGIALMDLTMGERSASLNLPFALVYAAAPVSGALMVIHLLAGGGHKGGGTSAPPAPQQPASTAEVG